MTAPVAIETSGLTKSFGHQLAVDDVGLSVPRGSVFGFLGPNGSGKTTTIRMLLGLASPTSGTIRMLDGTMPDASADVLPRVGALVEGPAFYPFLSGRANLHRLDTADRYAPRSTRKRRVDEALERVGLAHAAGKRAHAYSLGMKQRLGIANALLTPRELLILDEPSNGLDPQGTREVRNLIRSLAGGGTTVFVSSHLLAEVEQMCTHVAVMSAGRLVAQGTLDELRGHDHVRLRIQTPDVGQARQVLAGLGLEPDGAGLETTGLEPHEAKLEANGPELQAGGIPAPVDGAGTVTAPLTVAGLQPETVNAALVSAGVRVRGFAADTMSLEDRFVALTGEGFDVDH